MQERRIALPTDVQWHRVHPITPLLEGWKFITAIFALIVFQNIQAASKVYEAIQDSDSNTFSRSLPWVAVGALAVFVTLALSLWLSWRMRSYAVDRDAVYLRTGVFNKQLRTARLPRIQSVDVVHPLLGRIFGLGRLTVEVAGGADSHVIIGFLRSRELTALRDQILSLAAGQELRGDAVVGTAGASRPDAGALPQKPLLSDGAAAVPAGAAAGSSVAAPRGFEDALGAQRLRTGLVESNEHYLYEVNTKVLILSMLRSGATVSVLILIAVSLGFTVAGFVFGEGSGAAAAGLSALLPALAAPLALGGYVWSLFDKGWRFRAAATPAGIRMRFGLTSETSSTLPPGRVHGVKLSQGPFWRGPDWWRVETSVAGRQAAEPSSSGVEYTGVNVLLPVGERDTALRALWLVVPKLGVPDPDAFLAEALGDGLTHPASGGADGVGAGASAPRFMGISPRGRIFSPIAWRREGIALTDTCVVLRLGRFWRRTSVIPFERIQSLRVAQGPFARRRGLAAIHLDMVDAVMVRSLSNLSLADAALLAQVISERALIRRSEEQLDRWLARATA
ncbi:PH domain-containing protein [Actinomyces bovis]|uniref:PH domain-containing protein n=1 Tax=Actinomyces bovis TaxID=1658 RepID=UPI000DD079ED|nr:PH domain-containing protein [Actinomyces bovis]